MSKCKLCRLNELSKIKSHIFTESIIRSAVNFDGKTKRGGHEAMAQISIRKIGYSYFGESVLPEKREELLGFAQREENILETSTNEFINTGLLCSACERQLAIVESEFFRQIYSPIIENNVNCIDGFYKFGHHQAPLGLLFFLINIWRASVSRFSNWYLSNEDEEKIRNAIFNSLDDSIDPIIDKFIKEKNNLCNFSYLCCYLDHKSGPLSENIISIDLISNPFYFHLNRLIILFTFNNSEEIKLPDYLSEILKSNEFNSNICDIDKFEVKFLTDSQRKNLLLSYINRLSKDLFKHAALTFRDGFRHYFGYFPQECHYNFLDQEIKEYILAGNKLNIEGLTHCMAVIMSKIVSSMYSH